jgi:replicative DNA helicase
MDKAAKIELYAIDYAQIIQETRALRDLRQALRELDERITKRERVSEIVSGAENALRSIRLPGAAEGRTLREATERLIALLDDPDAIGVPTGLDALDRRLGGLYKGGLFLVAGRPSMGKTALATNFARNMARAGLRGHFASYEMGDEQIAARSLSAFAHDAGEAFAYSELRKGAARIDRARLRSLASSMPTTLIIEDKGAQTLGQLEASCRATARRLGGLDFVIVDYLQLMLPTTRGTRNDQITEISQGLKAMAKRLRVPIVALSQLSRANEQREDKRPQLSDLRDSGSLEQDADVVLGVYREHYYAVRDEPRPETVKGDKDRTPDENFSLAYHAWEQRCRACERTLEVITLKQRNGPVGTDVFEFFDKYDVARDRPDASVNSRKAMGYDD